MTTALVRPEILYADLRHVQRVASATLAECGRIDTWVNNAAVSMYGRCMDVPIEDLRRQMEVNSPCDAAPPGKRCWRWRPSRRLPRSQ